ncbi:uncharacterized protein LOC131665384 [Phymastichus coffea]|uniref:uncharacterized protein LOC131665384 n=1 Tax=Phymastichus coffea TaxID=108790 RepID=UPI00273BFAAB|nr:uncharacterized protein LOC131665384 [Phymastichus coffea]
MYKRNDEPSSANARSTPGRPWSVRAEFTIHRGETESPLEAPSRTATIAPATESSAVRMTYSFTPSQPPDPAPTPSYGFQRGNITFTSVPPQRSTMPARSNTLPRTTYPHRVQHEQHVSRPVDSGYASEQQVSREVSDKRCRSTYSIVLSSAKRANLAYPRPWTNYCQQHQSTYGQQQYFPARCHCDVLPELREDRPMAAASEPTATSKDTATQTTDIEAKMSPVAARKKVVRRKTPAVLHGSNYGDEINNDNFGRFARPAAPIRRSPTPPPPAVVQPSSSSSDEEANNTKEDDSSEKRKRTVHIDVYCTGTDDDDGDDSVSSSNSNDNDDDDDNATQTTVFESSNVRVTHTQANPSILPRGFQDEKAFLKRASERRCESFRNVPMRMPSLASSKGYESDDVLSSLYPSQFSSYSRLRDFESSIAWSAASSRSGITDESATSWKDTEVSVTPCDSFDYADSLDKERIKSMAIAKSWKSPSIERKHLLQGQLMKDYLKRNKPVDSSSESSSDSSDSDGSAEGVGWSFVSSEENSSIVRGKLTLPSTATALVDRTTSRMLCTLDNNSNKSAGIIGEVKTTIFRDRIGPFGSISPSPTLSKVQSRMTSPFTTPQGERTDHILKASIFGRVVNTFRKPGHHVGPAKNPSCSCEHCRRHFEEIESRVRSRSLDTIGRRRKNSSSNPPSLTN